MPTVMLKRSMTIAGEKPGAHAGEEAGAHAGEEPGAHAGEADGHDHAGESASAKVPDHKHIEAEAVKLSTGGTSRTWGLRLATVELRPFERTMTVPAMVVERPGRSSIAGRRAADGRGHANLATTG